MRATTQLFNCCEPAGLSPELVSIAVKCKRFHPQTIMWTGAKIMTSNDIKTLGTSRQRALHGILRVWQEVAIERPAEREEIQGLAALLLGRGAD